MNEPKAFCPQCRNEVAFEPIGRWRRCPVCGFQFQAAEPFAAPAPSLWPEAMSVLGVMLRVALIMAAVVIVGIGVLFAGCALMFR